MRRIFLLLVVLLLSPTFTQAAPYKAEPVGNILKAINDSRLIYMGRGLLFGFFSIESCVWANREMILIQNYCYPQQEHPAKGIVVWSKKFGIVEFYEEKLPNGIVKKDVSINQFPEFLTTILPNDLRALDINLINEISEKLYNRRNPACWSTNYDWNKQIKLAACYQTAVGEYRPWIVETQSIVNDADKWDAILRGVFAKIPMPGLF